MNSRPTFVQNSRFGRVIFQVRDGFLFISARRLGRPLEERVELRRLASDYEARVERVYSLFVIPLIGCLLCASVLWGIRRQSVVPQEALTVFTTWAVMGFVMSLILAIRGTPRVFFYVFKNQWGKPTLNLIREPRQASECDKFVTELVAHIELAHSGTSEEEKSKILSDLDAIMGGSLSQVPNAAKWKFSICLGALAAGIPLLPGAGVDPSIFIVVFPLCLGGAALSFFSFQAREPHRWWSLVGAVLSLIPPYFY